MVFLVTNEFEVGVQGNRYYTRFSSENGGIIEGTFYMIVTKLQGIILIESIPHLITGVFRCKRINIE
ncbi:MAG: hypothetical protein IPQ19_15415 [Bacteroidetes bacterium]|nr:hypothetical protein [Bacteroidota bacterium]